MDVQTETRTIQLTLLDFLQDPQVLLGRVKNGETIVILEAGKPIAEIRPVDGFRQRPFGLCAGEFRVPDDFDAPLPDHILQEFETG